MGMENKKKALTFTTQLKNHLCPVQPGLDLGKEGRGP